MKETDEAELDILQGRDPVYPWIKMDSQCSTKTPEPHLLGEFPMSCYNCHIYADS